jgi:hypothetical protein
MELISMVHRGLKAAGKGIAPLIALALVAVLFLVPVLAVLMARLYAGWWAADLVGAGTWMTFILFWVFVGLIGFYISPYIQPQIGAAMRALLNGPPSEG